MSVDASIVFLPRPTTLVGATTFLTVPLDVSQFSGAQFQVWRGAMREGTPAPGTFTVFLEESLDTYSWVLGPSTPAGFLIAADEIKMFSYSFRLRWFRLRIAVTGNEPIVTCWAEGLLRGGGTGVWPAATPPSQATSAVSNVMAPPAYASVGDVRALGTFVDPAAGRFITIGGVVDEGLKIPQIPR